MLKQMRGFSLIELVIVVVLLGLLAATALPRFLNITEDAEDATVEGVAGGFATAISLARAQWEVEGRPKSDITINMDGYYFHANDLGYPSGVIDDNRPDQMTALACKEVFDAVLQSPPTSTIGNDISEFRYYITAEEDAKGIAFEIPNQPDGISKRCVYYLVATLRTADKTIPLDAQAGLNTVGNGFTYDSATGQILPFSNNL
jgi:MSHA pilin protein MshB